MRYSLLIVAVVSLLLIASNPLVAQWQCLYATYDDGATNGTGYNTPSVGVISEDMFVALVMTPNVRNWMIPYAKADSSHGRINYVGYGGATAGIYQTWTDGGFDQVQLLNAAKLVARPDSIIYVANNDPEHNILIFKFTGDTVMAVPPFRRQPTGAKAIFGLAVDNNGYVYVSNDTSNGVTDDIKIYKPIAQWNDSHTDVPVRTINLPDGVYRGITVSPNGSSLFVCDANNRRILKFTGSPTVGYTQATSFSFQLGVNDTLTESPLRPIPINLGYLSPNNILFAATDVHGYTPSGTYGTYSYGRIYLINPNTGALISKDSSICVIDQAKWNFQLTGGYNMRTNGTVPGNESGYTSTYDVAFDSKGFVYSQSYFGWTVEKWKFNGTLPTISTGVERVSNRIPESFALSQNYPNPFNPTTAISYQLTATSFVTLQVFDILGKEVATLANEEQQAGFYTVRWDGSALPSGVYFYRLRAENTSTGSGQNFVETRKMILLR